jgi:hypothetical protein
MPSLLRRIQRDAHLVSRAAGDLDAARRGPTPLLKRLGRRWITRKSFEAARRAL